MTNNGLYISHEEVINMLHRDFKWAEGYWNEEDVLYSTREVIRLVGAKNVYKDTHAFILIEDGRGKIPSDVVLIDTCAKVNVDTIEDAINCPDEDLHFTPMRWMTDQINRRFFSTDYDYYTASNVTYKTNDGYMFSNMDAGVVCMFYQKLATDERGYLKIPDNISYLKAIANDVALKAADTMFMWDKLTRDKRDIIAQKRSWYVAQAGNSTKIPSQDERIMIKNNNLSWPGEYHPEKNFHLNLYKTQKVQ